MTTGYVLPPILNPFLYGVVCLILEITQLSAAPNPARSPVSGWIQPIVMALVLLELAPLMPELQASSSPPAPTTAAPAPAARSRPRRLMPPTGLVLFDCTVWWSFIDIDLLMRSRRRTGALCGMPVVPLLRHACSAS